jgi:hypothetical protein
MTKRITIQDLFPGESPEEQAEIERAFDRYLDLVELIYEDINADPKLRAQFDEVLGRSARHPIDSNTPPEGGVCEKFSISRRENLRLE